MGSREERTLARFVKADPPSLPKVQHLPLRHSRHGPVLTLRASTRALSAPKLFLSSSSTSSSISPSHSFTCILL
ncbi:hypothetical protein AC579_4769 [Pseudocercospora musae]|uniref:Uncharacterized protein n=1 Tax=Pseudocercospora musae TaxID=113226 RepID=A0A139IQP9_9PEZI|nr:hypothetical protein AC579_4769 [Pseudocercospora musae]